MATPAVSDLVYYSATALSGADWKTNFDQIVAWLTDTAADFSINSLTAKADVAIGGDLDVTGTITGDGAGITNIQTAAIADGAITAAKTTRNIASVRLADDFSTTAVSFTARTGASVSLTTTGTTSSVRVSVRSTWYLPKINDVLLGGYGYFRLNVDSGTYISLGTLHCWSPDGSSIAGFVGGDLIVSGLAAGAHTFALEVNSANAINNCSTTPTDYVCEVIAEEI